jgi:hypothetical protein
MLKKGVPGECVLDVVNQVSSLLLFGLGVLAFCGWIRSIIHPVFMAKIWMSGELVIVVLVLVCLFYPNRNRRFETLLLNLCDALNPLTYCYLLYKVLFNCLISESVQRFKERSRPMRSDLRQLRRTITLLEEKPFSPDIEARLSKAKLLYSKLSAYEAPSDPRSIEAIEEVLERAELHYQNRIEADTEVQELGRSL